MVRRSFEKKRKEIEGTELIINKESVLPGENALIKLNVGILPSGTKIHIKAHVFRAEKEGPTVLLVGGIHGDEINGIEIIRQMLEAETFEKIQIGTIIAIPIVNIYGFINFSREVPDGKDVNRSFPGNFKGSLASRVARSLTKKVLPHVDLIIDLHTGGGDRFNFPQLRYSKTDLIAYELAKKFGAPFIIQKPLISKSLRKVAHEMNKPTLVYEAGESLRFDGFSIDVGIRGIRNLLIALEMLPEFEFQLSREIWHVKRTTWLRASYSGLFLWSKCSGQKVLKGEPIGEIKDPQGLRSTTVISTRDGFIIGHNNASVINQGDALFHIAYEQDRIL